MSGLLHARTVETRWGLGLAFMDQDDEGNDVLKLQTWQPLGEDGGWAKVTLKIGLNSLASDDAHEAMWDSNLSAIANMTGDTFEAVFDQAQFGKALDDAIAKATGA